VRSRTCPFVAQGRQEEGRNGQPQALLLHTPRFQQRRLRRRAVAISASMAVGSSGARELAPQPVWARADV